MGGKRIERRLKQKAKEKAEKKFKSGLNELQTFVYNGLTNRTIQHKDVMEMCAVYLKDAMKGMTEDIATELLRNLGYKVTPPTTETEENGN